MGNCCKKNLASPGEKEVDITVTETELPEIKNNEKETPEIKNKDLSTWAFELHNEVNKRLGNSQISYDEFYKIYSNIEKEEDSWHSLSSSNSWESLTD